MVAQAAAAPPGASGRDARLDDALLAAARRALERHGLARTTLERIAEEAGVSRVTLYRRGVSREAVLAALTDAIVEDYRGALWPVLTGRGSAAARLERALSAACEVVDRHLELLLALGDRLGGGASGASLGEPSLTEPLERLLRDGASDRSLRQTDAREAATALLHLVVWTYAHLRAGPRWSVRRARRVTVELALRGAAEPEAPRAR
jgi:AcrR family transcriptional regulator